MITIVHGGQTGVDRAAHEAAIANGWRVAGYMPRDARDEIGKIPEAVARLLVPHEKTSYAARTAANVREATAALLIVQNVEDPRTTPGTAQALDLATARHLPRRIVDPTADETQIARWIWSHLRTGGTLPLSLEPCVNATFGTVQMRLLVAGPRESKWPGARCQTVALLHRVARALAEIQPLPDEGPR